MKDEEDKRGYAVGQFSDPHAELERLRTQAKLIAEREARALVEVGLPTSGRVLDLGCGPGHVAARLAALGTSVTGVDRDPTVLRVAANEIGVLRAEANALPFRDHTFDAVLLRLVLRHVPKPEHVVAEAARVLVPGGTLIITDTDDGTLVIDPEPAGFRPVFEQRLATLARRGGDPRFARKIRGLLVRAGLRDVVVSPLVVDSHAIGTATFASVVLAPYFDDIDPDLMAPAELLAARAALAGWTSRADAFAMTTAIVASGRR